jgi:hypothetical protein
MHDDSEAALTLHPVPDILFSSFFPSDGLKDLPHILLSDFF